MTAAALAHALAAAPAPRAAVERVIAGLEPAELAALWFEWPFWARLEQLAPRSAEWHTWLILAGRGFGKTRAMAEWVRGEVESGRARRIAFVGATAADVRDTMVRGESGILAVSPPWFRPDYEPSKRLLTWPNGAIATCYSAEEPNRLRGPQHDLAWCDELAAWERLQETWDNLLMGLRLGASPRVGIATTPRPLALLREMRGDPSVIVTGGKTWANAANLAPSFLKRLKRYAGTELGRQEIDAEILDDRRGAMFDGRWFQRVEDEPDLRRVVIAIDPAISERSYSDPTGIMACAAGFDDRGYLLGDWTIKASPEGWASAAIEAFDEHSADAFVVERNRGGDLVRAVLRGVVRTMGRREQDYPIHEVTATRGKALRADPIAALYERGQVVHVGPASRFAALENEMVTWDPALAGNKKAKSPNRLDAAVWGLTFLLLGEKGPSWSGFAEANSADAPHKPQIGELRERPDDDDDDGGGYGSGGGTVIG